MISLVPEKYLVEDTRPYTDFRVKTISGYKVTEVQSAFKKSLTENRLEEACHWGIELLSSGYIEKIFNCLFNIFTKNIYTNNPLLSERLLIRFENRFLIVIAALKLTCCSIIRSANALA